MMYDYLKKIPFLKKNAGLIRRIIKPFKPYLIGNGTKPISPLYGLDRGQAIDRFYIDAFLDENKHLIKGVVLELLNNDYTLRYGGDKVQKSDIIDIESDNASATIIADLRNMPQIADNTYDCIILTQTLHLIDEAEAALRECHRILKAGGVLLLTVPALSRIDCVAGLNGDFWRFTPAGLKHLLSKVFTETKVAGRGNARSGMWFFAGASQEDVSRATLDIDDPYFPVSVSAVAKK